MDLQIEAEAFRGPWNLECYWPGMVGRKPTFCVWACVGHVPCR